MTEQTNFTKITGTLLYIQMNEPAKAYQKAGTDPKAPEWKASVVITDEDYLDEFEDYVKELDSKTSIKKVKSADFEEIYHCPVPEGAGKNVWVVTFRKSTELGKTGKPVPDLYKPKVYEQVGNKMIEITTTKLIGNGSFGTVSTEVFQRTNGTASIYLKNLLVKNLIEYQRTEGSGYTAGSEFDEDLGGSPEVQKKTATAPSKPAAKAKAKPPVFDDMDDDIPF